MRLPWAVMVLAMMVAAGAIAVVYRFGWERAAAAGEGAVPEVIRAQRFEVVDANGTLRAEVGPVTEDGDIWLALYGGQEGHRVVSLGAQSFLQGDAGRLILDGEGGRVWLDATSLHIKDMQPFRDCLVDGGGMTLAVGIDPVFSSTDSIESTIEHGGKMPPSPEDPRKRVELRVGESEDGLPALSLHDGKGWRRVRLGAREVKERVAEGEERQVGYSLALFDEDGEVLWEAP